jgi:hypothetical protein
MTNKYTILLDFNFRRVMNVVYVLLVNSPASEFCMPTFRNTLSVPSSWAGRCDDGRDRVFRKVSIQNYYYLAGCTMFSHLPASIWQLYYLLPPVTSVTPVFFNQSLFSHQSFNPFRPGESSIGRLPRWRMGECSPDMVGTGEIKYPGQTKTSTAALQFDIGLSRGRGRKPW